MVCNTGRNDNGKRAARRIRPRIEARGALPRIGA